MKIFSQTIRIQTKKLFDFVKIDEAVKKVIKRSQIKNGFVLLRCLHTTAALISNEDDSQVHQDLIGNLKKLLPDEYPWSHTQEGINNARAHQASILLGQTHWLPLKNSRLELGTWQALFLIEFFQKRHRKVAVVVVGE